MEGGTQVDSKVLQMFQKSFVQVQSILDQNRLLISEINQNHESKIPDNLSRNVGLIRELNSNIRRVVDLYGDLSGTLTKSVEASSEGESAVRSDDGYHIKTLASPQRSFVSYSHPILAMMLLRCLMVHYSSGHFLQLGW